jgi:hypothetical protein
MEQLERLREKGVINVPRSSRSLGRDEHRGGHRGRVCRRYGAATVGPQGREQHAQK